MIENFPQQLEVSFKEVENEAILNWLNHER